MLFVDRIRNAIRQDTVFKDLSDDASAYPTYKLHSSGYSSGLSGQSLIR